MFFRSVNPMDAGGQLCDRSNSYCTVVFGSNNAQNASAKAAKQVAQNVLGQKIVKPISQDGQFYKAEVYHQDTTKAPSACSPDLVRSNNQTPRNAIAKDVVATREYSNLGTKQHRFYPTKDQKIPRPL